MLPAECTRCSSGPEGMDGHERLALLPMAKGVPPPARFVLHCLDCGTRWQRDFGGDSAIRWLRAASQSASRNDFPRES